MNYAASGNVLKVLYDFPVGFSLHFNCAYHIFSKTAFKPAAAPFVKTFGIADYITKNPVAHSDFFWGKSKGIMCGKLYKRIIHKFRRKRRAVNCVYRCAQLSQNPCPSAGTCSGFKTARSVRRKFRSVKKICKCKTFL